MRACSSTTVPSEGQVGNEKVAILKNRPKSPCEANVLDAEGWIRPHFQIKRTLPPSVKAGEIYHDNTSFPEWFGNKEGAPAAGQGQTDTGPLPEESSRKGEHESLFGPEPEGQQD